MADSTTPADVRIVAIETHSFCNRHCSLCPREQLHASRFHDCDPGRPIKEHLESKYIHAVLDDLADLNFRGRVQMFKLNEPLLDERLPDFVQYAAQRGLRVRVTTNGDPIAKDPPLLDRIAPHLEELSIGIYDYDLSQPDWPQRRNRLISEWQQRLAGLSDKVTVRFSLKEKFCSEPRDLPEGLAVQAPCPRVRDGVYVLYTGDVTHCCKDVYGGTRIGNIKQRPLRELLASPERRFVLQALARGDRWRFAACRDCMDRLPESCFANDPDADRDESVRRLGLKYGLARYPQPGALLGWAASDYLANPPVSATEVVPPSPDSLRPELEWRVPADQRPSLADAPPRPADWRFPLSGRAGNDPLRQTHEKLTDLAEALAEPRLPRALIVGEGRYLIAPRGQAEPIAAMLYRALAGQLSFVHFPETNSGVGGAHKRLVEWIHARHDVFVYCVAMRDAMRSAETGEPRLDLATFKTSLAYIVWRMLRGLPCRVVVVTPMPVGGEKRVAGGRAVSDADIDRYSAEALRVARAMGVGAIDGFSALSGTAHSTPADMAQAFVEVVAEGLGRLAAASAPAGPARSS